MLAVAIFAVHSMRGGPHRINTWSRYYTCDDGKSVFEDNDPHVAPFDHDGREAVQVYLIPGRDPGPESVWYLAKWSDEGKKLMEASLTAPGPGKPPPPGAVGEAAERGELGASERSQGGGNHGAAVSIIPFAVRRDCRIPPPLQRNEQPTSSCACRRLPVRARFRTMWHSRPRLWGIAESQPRAAVPHGCETILEGI